jgi:hypothetical protein
MLISNSSIQWGEKAIARIKTEGEKLMTQDNTAQANPQAPRPNPALQQLEVLVGEWQMELSNASFLPDPSQTVKGRVTFEWAQDGAFLALRMGDKPPSPPAALWLIGRDESAPNYTVLYYDARSVSRVYEMSFSDGVWQMWRNSPNFSQRYEGKISSDGKTIAAKWEKSSDGTTWEHDFDVMYTKIK